MCSTGNEGNTEMTGTTDARLAELEERVRELEEFEERVRTWVLGLSAAAEVVTDTTDTSRAGPDAGPR